MRTAVLSMFLVLGGLLWAVLVAGVLVVAFGPVGAAVLVGATLMCCMLAWRYYRR